MKTFQSSSSSLQDSLYSTIEAKNRDISSFQIALQKLGRNLRQDGAELASKLKIDFCTELRRIESTFCRLLYEREKEAEIEETVEFQRNAEEKSEVNF
jgi:hypothetical protein